MVLFSADYVDVMAVEIEVIVLVREMGISVRISVVISKNVAISMNVTRILSIFLVQNSYLLVSVVGKVVDVLIVMVIAG